MAQANDIAIDLGTSNVVIYMKGRGIVFREPSVVAVDRETQNIIAFGMEAYRMIGRTPANVNVIRPLAQGEMLDFDLTSAMLRFFVSSVIGRHILARPRAVMAVPTGVKDMEKKALISSMFEAGIRRTQLMDKNIAAALGAQLNFLGSYGCLVVDISAGCTDLAVLYNSSVSVISSVHIGGDHFDDAIIRYLRKKYNMLIGERTAEQVKVTEDAQEALRFLQEGRGMVIANTYGDRPEHIGVFSDSGHYIVLAAAQGTEVKVWDPMYKEGSGRYDVPGRKGKVRLDGTDAYADFSEIEQDCYERPYFLFWKE